MDYNEVRKRKKNSGTSRRTGRNSNDKKLIIIAVIVLLLAIAAGVIIVMSVWPKNGEDINTEEYQIQETAVPEIMETATPEPTLEPTPTPIVSKGTKEQIPQDVWASMQGKSYTPNNNVGYDDLMYLSIPYYDFDGNVQMGHMVVAADVADDVLNIFSELFEITYPIERMELIDKYFDMQTEQLDSPDRSSMGRNNTSSFCYRVVSGSGNLSNHAYGRAIDLNPLTNPWEKNGNVSPRNAVKYASNRAQTRAGTDFTGWTDAEYHAFIGSDTDVYKIFRKYGWEWGGEIWGSEHDYQHFQKRK